MMEANNDDRVILYPAGGRFNRLRRKQHFLNELLQQSFEGWEQAQNKKDFVCRNILSKIPGGIWVFDREREVPVRTDAKDVENRILQKMRDMKKSLRGGGRSSKGAGPSDDSASSTLKPTPPRKRQRRAALHDENTSEEDEIEEITPTTKRRKRLSQRQKDLLQKRGGIMETSGSENEEEEEEDYDSDDVDPQEEENVHLEAADIVQRALQEGASDTDSEDNDLPTPIFIDHLSPYETSQTYNTIQAVTQDFCIFD